MSRDLSAVLKRRSPRHRDTCCSTETPYSLQKKSPVIEETTIPEDVLMDILSRLPVKSLIRFQCVDKSWAALVEDPLFTGMHVKRSIESKISNLLIMRTLGIKRITQKKVISVFSPKTYEILDNVNVPCEGRSDDHLKIVGSCNGVLCLTRSFMGTDNYLFNPSTREVKKLPKPDNLRLSWTTDHFRCQVIPCVGLGFGFSSMSEDYKLVRIHDAFQDPDTKKVYSRVDIYALTTNSWTRPDNVGDGYIVGNVCKELLHGMFHWRAIRVDEDKAYCSFVMSFDIENETFGAILLPDFAHNMWGSAWLEYCVDLFVLKESLAMIVSSLDCMSFDVWVMNRYGAKESWTKHSTIGPFGNIMRMVGFKRNCEILLVNYKDSKLSIYDPVMERTKDVPIKELSWRIEVFNYMESPVRIMGRGLLLRRQSSWLVNPLFYVLVFVVLIWLSIMFCYFCGYYYMNKEVWWYKLYDVFSRYGCNFKFQI